VLNYRRGYRWRMIDKETYLIPCGKHRGKAIDNLPDNILAGLVWAYRPDGLDNEELHGECFAVLYERHGTARAVVGLVDRFEEWAESKPAKKTRKKPKTESSAFVSIDSNESCPF
jgi:hypothetical protein